MFFSDNKTLKDLEVAANSAIPESDQAKSRPPPLKCKGELVLLAAEFQNGRVEKGGKSRGIGGKFETALESTKKMLKEKRLPLEVLKVFES